MSFIQKYNKYKNKHLQIGGSTEELNKTAYELNDEIEYIYDMNGTRLGVIVDTNEYAEQYEKNPEPNYYTYIKIDDPQFKPHYVNMRDKDILYVIANRHYRLPPPQPAPQPASQPTPQPASQPTLLSAPRPVRKLVLSIIESEDKERFYIKDTYSDGTFNFRVITKPYDAQFWHFDK